MSLVQRHCARSGCETSLSGHRADALWCSDACRKAARRDAITDTARNRPPQRITVLKMLEAAGSRGVHTFEIRQAYIGNPSQRIAELEALGYQFSHTRERLHGRAMGTRYRLLSPPSDVEAPAAPVSEVVEHPSSQAGGDLDAGQLFDLDAV